MLLRPQNNRPVTITAFFEGMGHGGKETFLRQKNFPFPRQYDLTSTTAGSLSCCRSSLLPISAPESKIFCAPAFPCPAGPSPTCWKISSPAAAPSRDRIFRWACPSARWRAACRHASRNWICPSRPIGIRNWPMPVWRRRMAACPAPPWWRRAPARARPSASYIPCWTIAASSGPWDGRGSRPSSSIP